MAISKKFTIKNWVNNEYVTLYPKTTADQIIQDSTGRLVSDVQIEQWTQKQEALGYVPEDTANKGKAGGYASLDGEGKLEASQLPKEAIIDAFEVNSEEAMLQLQAQKGDICVRTDLNRTYVLRTNDPTLAENWVYLRSEIAPVSSVNGQTGAVVITTETINAVNKSEVTETAEAGKILKLNQDAKFDADITGDAATVAGRRVDDDAVTTENLWTASKTDTVIKNALSGLNSSLDWKEAVATFDDIATTYPNPEDGWTVNVKDTNYTYRFDGNEWIVVSANAIPNATDAVDGLMSKEDKAKIDGIEEGANNYVHPDTHAAAMIVEDDEHQFITADQKAQYEENTVYTNDMPTVTSLGGIAAGTTFANMPINELLTTLLYPYIAPTISFSANPGAQVREYGDPINEIKLTANTTKKSKNITEVKFYEDSQLIHTVDVPKAGGGSETFTVTTPVTAGTLFKATVSDGQTITTSGSVNYTFVYPMYVGNVKEASPAQDEIVAMEKLVITKPSQTTKAHTLTDARFCIAYPASYGNLKSVLDANQLEILGDFVKETKEIVGLDGTSQPYNVYTFKNVVTMTNFTVTYKF